MSTKSFLKTKRYYLYWFSSLLSNMGTWMQQVAQPWIILQLNPSSFWVGLDSFALNGPGWLFTLWGGMIADRFDKKKTILFFQGIQGVCVFILFILLLTSKLNIAIIILISFLIGSTDALSVPAYQTIIPALVQKDEIPRAVALNSVQMNLSRVLGPALAGIMIATYGAITCVGANLFSYFPFFFSIYLIYPKNHPSTNSTGPFKSEYQNIIRNKQYLIPLFTLFITMLFCGQIMTFCAVFIQQVYHAGALELGWATAAFGIGGVLGAVIASRIKLKQETLINLSSMMAIVLGLCILIISQASSLVLFQILLFFAGIFLTMTNILANTALQLEASQTVRGQVSSLFQLSLRGGLSLGGLISGGLSSYYDPRWAFALNGAAAIIFQTSICIFMKKKSNTYAEV